MKKLGSYYVLHGFSVISTTCAHLNWYAGLNKTLKKKLQISQNKVVQFIKKLGPRSHIGFSELDSVGFLNVDKRVKQLRLNHVFKIFNGTFPSYLLDHFHKISESHRYNTRGSSKDFFVPRVSSRLPQLSSLTIYRIGMVYLQT